jgi:hypothetical protein
MRPGQQNKRMRGRGRRSSPNPLSRSYESNGPDVKVRGTAAHIAEKYMQLARDAHASGDPVMAESYLQHAEHYFRIIAAAQVQSQQQQGSDAQQPQRYNGGGRYDSADDDGDDTGEQPSAGQHDAEPRQDRQNRQADAQPQARNEDGPDSQPPQAEQPAPRRRRRRAGNDEQAADPAGQGAEQQTSSPASDTSVRQSETPAENADA